MRLAVAILVVSLGLGVARHLPPKEPIPDVIKTPRPPRSLASSVTHIDWRNVNGTVFTTPVVNQKAPKYCGSCWAQSVASALSDRLKIASKAQQTDITLSVQDLLDCGFLAGAGSCHGGSFEAAHKYIHEHGIVDVTCMPYMADDYHFVGQLSCDSPKCITCDRFASCSLTNATRVWGVSEYGTFEAHDAVGIAAEVAARGPVIAGMYAHNPAFDTYTSGIIDDQDLCSAPEITHDVSIVGYGVTSRPELSAAGIAGRNTTPSGGLVPAGTPYWIVRNSFGVAWGEDGFFRAVRGRDCLGLERGGGWAVPERRM
eukprot:TRINITY_DN24608_c0_g1_i1.p1 TRINITY_DN24608_c0_g1~~TRINITY_DN24608_c0_g1_i1.p1  ORF type:complete len:314 (-),score=37.00 TRINITY_DN24608_c0_g1_i1:118-1059(-)